MAKPTDTSALTHEETRTLEHGPDYPEDAVLQREEEGTMPLDVIEAAKVKRDKRKPKAKASGGRTNRGED